MIKKTVKFIHKLRIYLFALILIAFLIVIGLNPIELGRFIGAKLGSAMNMTVSVPENPINKLALQLKEKEERLDQREAELNLREQVINQELEAKYSPLLIIILVGIIVLFLLIILNYYLDFRRRRREQKK